MRDLHATGTSSSPNGVRLDLDDEPAPDHVADIDRQYREVRREQKVAGVAVMLLDAAKMIEPVVELLCDRALRWAALAATVGLTAYALSHPSWERAAICAGFAVLAPWIIRRAG